jgi:hypothetical protein
LTDRFTYDISLSATKANVKLDIQGPYSSLKISQGLHMKLRTHEAGLLGLVVGLLCIVAAGPASSQGVLPPPWSPNQMQPPFMAPTQPSMYRGIFYLSAGVRFRNINTFRFDSLPHDIAYRDNGVPPFGPDSTAYNVPIPFGSGTGLINTPTTPISARPAYPVPTPVPANPTDGPPGGTPPGDPRDTGVWFYLNGFIDSRWPPHVFSSTCDDPTSGTTIPCPGGTNKWQDPADTAKPLGRSVVTLGGTNCCAGVSHGHNSGSFLMTDLGTQPNNSSVPATTRLSWEWIINGTYNTIIDPRGSGATPTSNEVASQIWTIPGGVFANQEFGSKPWTPSFEAGVQYSDYFDFFTGFSFYNLSNSTTKTFVAPGQFRRRAFRDSFSFFGDQDAVWSGLEFNSAVDAIGGEDAHQFQITPDGPSKSGYPTRTFFEVAQALQPGQEPVYFQETMGQRADIDTYELRFGGRSWFPIWGIGRLGVVAGPLFNFINYRLAGSRYVVSISPPPAAGQPGLPPGTVIENVVGIVSDTQFKFGGFFGTDLEVYLGNRGFLKASAEYAVSDKMRYQLLSIQTEFDPGGFNSYLAAGLSF